MNKTPPFTRLDIAEAPDEMRGWWQLTRMTTTLMRDEQAARAFIAGCIPSVVRRDTAIVLGARVNEDSYDPVTDSWDVMVRGKGEPIDR